MLKLTYQNSLGKYSIKAFLIGIILLGLFLAKPTKAAAAPSISVLGSPPTNVRVYEKYEIRFNVETVAEYPFFQYDENPPSGVESKAGITVEGVFITPSGKTLRHPGFFMTEVERTGSGDSMRFTETSKKYWALRFSPQETGQYQVSISVQDASGSTTVPVGNFTAQPPTKKGFIRVSQQDLRYFEFSNGDLYWPIGPAWSVNHSANPGARSYDYSQYKGTGQNLERPWMGGRGAYSTNWARWMSSAEKHGNEGIMTRLNWKEHYPGHDLSYEIFCQKSCGRNENDMDGWRMWMGWLDEPFKARFKKNTRYQIKLRLKTRGISPYGSGDYGLKIKLHNWRSSGKSWYEHVSQQPEEYNLIPIINSDHNWYTVANTYQTPNADDLGLISLYLHNVSSGEVYIDEFSVREILPDSSLGGELIRNPRADQHTYVEQRPAAFFDWQVEQGEENGVFFKYVVHDKNDWIQNHLLNSGQFADSGNGYYQDENTKARWLLRQWYRYLIARWGYSTAIHSWELNNEGPPNESPSGSGTAPHWQTAQAFAKFMHDNDAHQHLATTSFWCCWRPAFWGNNNDFPDIDYADIHEYTRNDPLGYDMAEWTSQQSMSAYQDQVGKPVMRAETGISDENWTPISELEKNNPGIWYHNLLWAQLNKGAMSDPNYWFSQHLKWINREEISRPFSLFVKDLDLNKGGYVDLDANISDANIRVFGQKNVAGGRTHLWIQNKNHTWKKVIDGSFSGRLSGTVTISGFASNTSYPIEWWDFDSNGNLNKRSGTVSSDSSGRIALNLNSLASTATDTGVKIGVYTPGPTPTPTPTPSNPYDLDGDDKAGVSELLILLQNWGSTSLTEGDFNDSGRIDAGDLITLIRNWG